MNKSSFLLAGMFLLGCAAASVLAPLRVPSIRAGTSPQKWEQMCIPKDDDASGTKIGDGAIDDVNKPTGWNKVLAAYGSQGWELVAVMYHNPNYTIQGVCFKRPL